MRVQTRVDELLRAAIHAFTGGNHAEAVERCEQVLTLDPHQADALHLMGLAQRARGDAPAAIEWIRRALALTPGRAEFHYSLADTFAALARNDEAMAAYREAICLDPRSASAYVNLGKVLHRQGRVADAAAVYRQATEADPNAPLVHFNLAVSLSSLGDHGAALQPYLKAVQLNPQFFDAHLGLGSTWVNLGEIDNAAPCFRNAVALRPDHAEAWANLGTVLIGDRDAAEARACFEKALALDPECARARLGLGRIQLMAGDLAAGWDNFEYRLSPTIHRPLSPQRSFPFPRWQGEPLAGKNLFVWREEGLGDEILFSSCLPDAAAQAARCVIECSPRLVALFARSFPTCAVRAGTTADTAGEGFDVHCPMGSLPRFLRRHLADFPRPHVYLRADPARVQSWRERLTACGPGLKGGFLWRSLVTTAYRRHFYAPPEAWTDILAVPGTIWVDLQYGASTDERHAIEERHGIAVRHFPDLDLVDDVDNSAALLAALDVVVGPSTTYTALAAALGTPTLIPSISQVWDRLGQDRHPFFPAARLFNKPPEAEWTPVLREVAAALRDLVRDGAPPAPSPGAVASALGDEGRLSEN